MAATEADPSARQSGRGTGGIRFEDVTVAYNGNVVLDSFSLDVAPGEVVALLGPSGSGKTTALRAVAGFVRPASGRVYAGGRDVTDLPPYKRGLGMVVQQYALFPHMRVEQNVAFGLKTQKVAKSTIPGRVAEALRMTGMAQYAKRYPRELSGGQQQRVAIARALAIEPSVLLLDEPLSALDAQLRSGMLAELARLHRELPDVSILYVTHDQIEALTLADRIAVMNDARLVEVGTARELYKRPGTEFAAGFVGNSNLLPVTVTGCAPQPDGSFRATVRIAAEAEPVMATCTEPATVGEQRTLCLRPHFLGLTAAEHHDNAFLGKITEVQWRGSSHRVFADAQGHEVRLDTTELRNPPVIGDEVWFHFSTEDAVLIPAAASGLAPAAAAATTDPTAPTAAEPAEVSATLPASADGAAR
ncbi:ABC transporter ATP-binding protein [Catenulispora rubra]|uniref:ABC transporter ATP-binding protein n=1 Tax=Catenulispora rubra TaxID=280293 RepID=UPI0018925E0E|nr:ABC transporter ATP-binding protein [Catenulispora rubra]